MNISLSLLSLSLLAIANTSIDRIQRGNIFQRISPRKFSSIAKPHLKTNYASFSTGINDEILRNEMMMRNDGSYRYQFETSNGITAKEQGHGGISVKGTSSYISPEGVLIEMSYTADENGFRPVGDHIPKTPDYILKALEFIRTHPFKEIYKPKRIFSSSSNKISKLITSTETPISSKVTPKPRRTTSFASNYKLTEEVGVQNEYQF